MSRIIFVTKNSDSGDYNPSLLKCGLYLALPQGTVWKEGGWGSSFVVEKHCPARLKSTLINHLGSMYT